MNKLTFPNLKVAIVGCGNMARVHARLLAHYVLKENIAVCDNDQLRLDDFAKTFSISNKFNNLNQLLGEFKPDVVHIVTPPGLHATLAVQCLAKGCHVLIEKPMCLTLKEADDIIAFAKKNKRSVCVDHMRVCDPLTIKAKNILASGQLGEIVNVDVNYSYDYLKRIHSDPGVQ